MIGYVVTNNNDAFMCSVDESNHEFTKIDNNEHIDVHESVEKAFESVKYYMGSKITKLLLDKSTGDVLIYDETFPESVIKYLTIKKVFKI